MCIPESYNLVLQDQAFPEWPGHTFHAAQEYSGMSVYCILFPLHGQDWHSMQHKSLSTLCFRNKGHLFDQAMHSMLHRSIGVSEHSMVVMPCQHSMRPRIFWKVCFRDLLPQCGQVIHSVQTRIILCCGFQTSAAQKESLCV